MRSPMFSIIMVSLNPGDKLVETMESVARQTYADYEVIVKDGGSQDGSLDKLREYLAGQKRLVLMEAEAGDILQEAATGEAQSPVVRIMEQPDHSIYEGMNQATVEARGEYLYFLNCGDGFASETALEEAAAEISRTMGEQAGATEEIPRIFYGDIFDSLRSQVVASNPHMDAFACYRNVPCHQACIYHYSLFSERGYEPGYRVRADYEHFLWCYFVKKVQPQYIPVTLAAYEGGGFSETPENRRRSAQEHREITAKYMKKGQLLKYRLILLLTLAPLRTKMAESPAWSGIYNRCKKLLYRRDR